MKKIVIIAGITVAACGSKPVAKDTHKEPALRIDKVETAIMQSIGPQLFECRSYVCKHHNCKVNEDGIFTEIRNLNNGDPDAVKQEFDILIRVNSELERCNKIVKDMNR